MDYKPIVKENVVLNILIIGLIVAIALKMTEEDISVDKTLINNSKLMLFSVRIVEYIGRYLINDIVCKLMGSSSGITCNWMVDGSSGECSSTRYFINVFIVSIHSRMSTELNWASEWRLWTMTLDFYEKNCVYRLGLWLS